MKCSRRQFLVRCAEVVGGTLAAGLLTQVGLARTGLAQPRQEKVDWPSFWQEHEWGFVVDIGRCIGCGRCVRACKEENGVPLDREVYRTWVERYGVGADVQVNVTSPKGGLEGFPPPSSREIKSFFVPKLCNQCAKPPCVKVCPVAATYRTGDGVILVDQKRCIGCRYCIQACPYGARFLHPALGVADKCTWCYHRIVRGLLPACVQVCPTGARIFGDFKQPDSPVAKILTTQPTSVLKPAMGTEPMVHYLGLDGVVI